MKRVHYWFGTAVLALMAAALTFVLTYHFVVTPTVDKAVGQAVEATKKAYEPYMKYGELSDKVVEVGAYLEEFFVGDYQVEDMKNAVASAMVAATGDEWSYYLSADELTAYYENMSNSYVGIGVTVSVSEEDGGLKVTDVTRDAPAYQAGIKVDDIITHVNGESTIELGLDASRDRIRGEEGTQVTLTIKRKGEEFDLTLTRRSIQYEVVTYEVVADYVGLITITNFDEHVAQQTIIAVEELKNLGVKSIIFDVRFNPGGYKRELCAMLDYLLPEGIIFQSREKDGSEEIIRSGKSYLDMPMAVLVNIESFSAAEFFGAALQEYDAAVIVGEQTYGKGYFQRTYQLSDGSGITLSSGTYFTPNGVSLAGVGITPDIVVELDDESYANLYYGLLAHEDDPQLQAAIRAMQEQIGTNIAE